MSLLTDLPAWSRFALSGSGQRPSAFAVSELATLSIAAVGLELAAYMRASGLVPETPETRVDHRLASLWFGWSFRPQGWEIPNAWDAVAGDYQSADGWIKLHTNLPHHKAAALRVLDCAPTREEVAKTVHRWNGSDLEGAIIREGGVAAAMRSRRDWTAHPQGKVVAGAPLITWTNPRHIQLRPNPRATAERPLAGLRILDLTRVLAGPVSTRTLAGFGAQVLRVDPPGWDEPGVIPDISLGKRCTCLDLKTETGLHRLKSLLPQADILVHGYRPGALDGLGLGRHARAALAPDQIEITLDAYGWTGPWARRRGFDSLVQMSAGIAETGRRWAGSDTPTPLPVQALDHATGYLMAAAALSALKSAAQGTPIADAHLSLARTAESLVGLEKTCDGPDITAAEDRDYAPQTEASGWGPGFRLRPALDLSGTQMRCDLPAGPLGTSPARW